MKSNGVAVVSSSSRGNYTVNLFCTDKETWLYASDQEDGGREEETVQQQQKDLARLCCCCCSRDDRFQKLIVSKSQNRGVGLI